MENIMRSVFSITINERKNMSNILQYFLNLHAHTILFLHFHVKFICIFWNFPGPVSFIVFGYDVC